jgi:putative transposase
MKHQDDLQPLPDRAELERTVESLKCDTHELQLEHDLLKIAAELLKKGQGINLILLSNREKTLMIDALRQTYAVPELLVELGLARSSYFYHRARLLGPDKYVDVRLAITDVFELNHRCYGYRRIKASLCKQHLHISEGVVRRLMGQAGLTIATPRRRRYHSYGGEISPAPDNIINRDFHAAKPNEKWLTDITEFHIPAGKVYLSPMIDCFDGMVVSWSLGTLQWMLLDGTHSSIDDLSRAEKITTSYVSRVLRLAYLSPTIVEAILDGKYPAHLTLKDLMRPFPLEWDRQVAHIFVEKPVDRFN